MAQRYCLFITFKYHPYVPEANRWLIPYPEVDIPNLADKYRLQEEQDYLFPDSDKTREIYKSMFDDVFMHEVPFEKSKDWIEKHQPDLMVDFIKAYNFWTDIKNVSIKLPIGKYIISEYVLHGVFIAPDNP